MSADRDVTRIVRSWLHEDAYEDADRILNLVLDEIDTTPQRRASWLARRFPPMSNNMRVALAVAAVVVIALVGIGLLIPRNVGNPTESAIQSAIPDGYYETVVSQAELAADDVGLCPCTWGFTLNSDQFGLTGQGEQPTRVEFSGDQMTLPEWDSAQSDPSITVRWVFDAAAQTVTFTELTGGTENDKLVFERTWTKVAAGAETPPRLDRLPEGDLAAGTYEIDAVFPVRLTFTVPVGFGHGRGASDGVGIQGNPGGRGIEFQIASNVYPDPCHSAAGAANPPIGPAVDDLVTAMTNLVGFQAGPVTDVTIGGLPAKAFDLTNEIDQSTCDGGRVFTFSFADASGPSGVGQGQRERIYVMDVQGTRLMIMTYYFSDETGSTDAAEAATLAAIVQSIRFP
jgi:hypothetical protein